MFRSVVSVVVLLAGLELWHPVAAQAVASQTKVLHDEKIDLIASDLRALGRIAAVASDLNDSRQVMLAIIDSDVENLRERRDDGTYRWASLQREEASRIRDEKSIERAYTEKELREVMVTAPNAYRLEVAVPTKRNLVSGNNRVFVRNVLIDSTGFDGKTTHHEIPLNVWVIPGDATGVPLAEIAKSAKATAELGVESGEKRAVATVALLQARLVDDPTAPNYPAVKRLLQIRDVVAAKEINRGLLKTTSDEALLALPGELERRSAEQAAAADRRKQGAGSPEIKAGDATPEVVAAIQELSRLLGGTLQDQSDARAKLQELVRALQPPAPAP